MKKFEKQGLHQGDHISASVINVAGATAVDGNLELKETNLVHISEIDIKKHFGLKSLSSIKKDHMTQVQRNEIDEVFAMLKEWFNRRKTVKDASFVLLGDSGQGKTHIAECAHDSLCSYAYGDDWIDLNDPATLRLLRHSRFYTAEELMDELTNGTFSISSQIEMIVVDEIGREGSIKWEKKDFESQDAAKKHLYFKFVNACVDRCSVFITSNTTATQFKEFFDDATISRLMGMCAPGHMYEMVHVPDYRLVKSGRAKKEI